MIRYPDAVVDLAPAWKQEAWVRNAGLGVVLHSMAGSYPAAKARLFSTDRASWHFSVLEDGTVIQHYDIWTVCWHAGYTANTRYIGIEHEGVGPPITEAQVKASAKLVRWLGQQLGWPRFQYARDGQLQEHNWWMATACPAGRIPWERYIQELTEVDEIARNRMEAAAAFEIAAAAIKRGEPLQNLPPAVKDTVVFMLRLARIV